MLLGSAAATASGVAFRDQVDAVGTWFSQWNECEQTVALYSLLKKLPITQARFLALALDRSLSESSELQRREQQANNAIFVSSLLTERKDLAIQQLLMYLPLLHPGNAKTKAMYLNVIPKVLTHAMELGVQIEESRQLLSYSLIHPAFTSEERRSLTLWMRHLEDRISNYGQSSSENWCNQQMQRSNSGSLPPANGHGLLQVSTSATTSCTQVNHTCCSGYHPKFRRSNSLTPPVNVHHSSDGWNSQDELVTPQKQRSFSFSLDHAPLSPQNSLASSGSGSDTHLDDPKTSFSVQGSGMRDVPSWLKSLRLHKYVSIFSQMTYDEMLVVTEEQLESLGVTKGARHKIVLSLGKLKERQRHLQLLEKDVVEGGDVRNALGELKAILATPIKPYLPAANTECITESDSNSVPEGDLSSQFTKVMGKVCSQLLMASELDGESMGQFLCLAEKCIQHEAFTDIQRKKFASWKHRIHEARRSLPPHRIGSRRHTISRWNTSHYVGCTQPDNGFTASSTNGTCTRTSYGSGRFGSGSSSSSTNYCPRAERQTSAPFSPSVSFAAASTYKVGSINFASASNGMTNLAALMAKRPSLQESLLESPRLHATVQRTKSAPSAQPSQFASSLSWKIAQLEAQNAAAAASDAEMAGLESLCLSMTEHALGTADL